MSISADSEEESATAERGVDIVDGVDDRQAPDDVTSARATWMSVARSAGVRVLVLPVSAILGVVNTRLIIENFGRDAFAQYGLLVALGALLPFADLGMAAAIMNAVGASEKPSTDRHVRAVLVTSIRVLLGSAAVLLAITGLISVAGWWPLLLGDGLMPGTGPFVAAACLATIAITLPVSFGQRVLSGLGKNHVTVAMLGLQTPIVLVVLLCLIRFDLGDGSYLPVVPYLVTGVISVLATVVAARLMHPAVGQSLRDVPRIRSVRGGRVFDVAWPMLVQMVALPVAMQSDRIVLSHVAGPAELAEYNLAAQMYLPIWQVVTAAGVALWPIFARARARGERGTNSPMPIAAGFAGAALAAAVVITIAAPWLADLASGGRIEIPTSLLLAFSFFMVLQGTKYPLGMFMTDAAGLRYQAVMIVMMLPVNLGISIVLAREFGPIGPVIGSAVGVLIFQVLANAWYVRQALRHDR
ncbi:MAG TPA: oligosaccharide flippase family protein [Microthrixaceae bacterium]|nr:oligosaccharide flippase family protein [Microthrixaceae bacterium]